MHCKLVPAIASGLGRDSVSIHAMQSHSGEHLVVTKIYAILKYVQKKPLQEPISGAKDWTRRMFREFMRWVGRDRSRHCKASSLYDQFINLYYFMDGPP